jgi:hypothetical protein
MLFRSNSEVMGFENNDLSELGENADGSDKRHVVRG